MTNDLGPASTLRPGVIEHFLPKNAEIGDVELSIVIPASNEEMTVGEFIEWCKEGIKRAGVAGQKDELTLGDVKGHVLQGHGTVGIGFVYVGETDHGGKSKVRGEE